MTGVQTCALPICIVADRLDPAGAEMLGDRRTQRHDHAEARQKQRDPDTRAQRNRRQLGRPEMSRHHGVGNVDPDIEKVIQYQRPTDSDQAPRVAEP